MRLKIHVFRDILVQCKKCFHIGLLDREDEVTTTFRNVSDRVSVDMVLTSQKTIIFSNTAVRTSDHPETRLIIKYVEE
jgi:hypothetical protein